MRALRGNEPRYRNSRRLDVLLCNIMFSFVIISLVLGALAFFATRTHMFHRELMRRQQINACAPGLSTGRRLMPMPARCGAAAPCRGAATVRRSPHTRRVLRRVLLGRGCLCGAHRARATASTTKRLHACACEGADEKSWQSRPRHESHREHAGGCWVCGMHC